MKKLYTLAIVVAGMATFGATAAEAAQGCGPAGHRGPHGHCRVNRGPLIVGHHYEGRGYWDGHRYYQNRYRHHGGWRYR